MWIDELNNVVIENKTKKTFHEKVLWSHDGLNVQIQFVHCYSWGSVELKSEQYEAIEETSSDTHTYDTQYNTESVYNIVEFENLLFVDDKIFVGTEFCVTRDQSGKYPIPTDDTLSAMLDLTWFEEKYGFCKKDISNIDESIFRNTLIDNLVKEEIVHLNVQGKAFHEWAMKIMEFLQSNDFTDVKLRTLED